MTSPIAVVFSDYETRVCNLISQSPPRSFIYCAMAWFTNTVVLDALQTLASSRSTLVCILLQKEGYLFVRNRRYNTRLGLVYSALACTVAAGTYPTNCCCTRDMSLNCIRYIGSPIAKTSRYQVNPLMHHKFMVWGNLDSQQASSVWTGSTNFTKNANRSMENAVHIVSSPIAELYKHEFLRLFAGAQNLPRYVPAKTKKNPPARGATFPAN